MFSSCTFDPFQRRIDPQHLADAPCLRKAAFAFRREVAAVDLGQLADAAFPQHGKHRIQLSADLCSRFRAR